MKILLDFDILLDVIQKNEPFYSDSSAILSKVLTQEVQGVLPGHLLPNIFYSIESLSDMDRAKDMVDWFIANFDITPLTKETFLDASVNGVKRFESAIIAACAETAGCDFIISRNADFYKASPVPAIFPKYALKILEK